MQNILLFFIFLTFSIFGCLLYIVINEIAEIKYYLKLLSLFQFYFLFLIFRILSLQ
jgi:hypothetical protein